MTRPPRRLGNVVTGWSRRDLASTNWVVCWPVFGRELSGVGQAALVTVTGGLSCLLAQRAARRPRLLTQTVAQQIRPNSTNTQNTKQQQTENVANSRVAI